MGFVLALVGILASLSSARIIRNMQRSGHFNVLLALLLITAFVYGLLTICGVVISITKPIENYYFSILGFLSLWAILLLLDSMKKLWSVISLLHPGTTQLE